MKHYSLVVGLIIVGGILLLIGRAMVSAPNSGARDAPRGLLVGTIRIAAWKSCDRIASALGKAREYARHLMQLALSVCPLIALGGGQIDGGWSSVIFGSMLRIESLAVLIWLSLARSTVRIFAGQSPT
jgi:hypothetical protein